MEEYVTFKSVCSVCGEIYASKKVHLVFKDDNDPRLKVIRRDGHVKSHGYCPKCQAGARQELRLVARKAINTYA